MEFSECLVVCACVRACVRACVCVIRLINNLPFGDDPVRTKVFDYETTRDLRTLTRPSSVVTHLKLGRCLLTRARNKQLLQVTMADDIPIIPKAGHLWVHTGNIVNWNRLKKKLTQVPAEEVMSESGRANGISEVFDCWLATVSKIALACAYVVFMFSLFISISTLDSVQLKGFILYSSV